MITQGIDAGTGETEGLDAAGTKARSAQADAPKSLNSPTTTQGEALEARARIANAITDHEGGAIPDHVPVLIDAGDLRAITAALQPNIDHAVGGVEAPFARPTDPSPKTWDEWTISPVKLDAVREALERIADVSERWENSLVSQINQIAREALANLEATQSQTEA